MVNALQYNIKDTDGRLLCPACGFPDYATHPAYNELGGIIGTTICPCCFWEPGFDDSRSASAHAKQTILETLQAHRDRWGSKLQWTGQPEIRPDNWNGETQISRLFELAPHVSS